jgi:V-type H+-transporting ATPase subunit d
MELSFFNVNHGFTEALIRGLRSGFLGPEDYRRLQAATSLEDLRSALEETDYGTFLQDEPSPMMVATIHKKCYEKLADEFRFVKAQTVEPATTILDFMAREKMIENVVTIVQGVANKKTPAELKEKMHPLGMFEGMNVMIQDDFDISVKGFEEVYRIFLEETPIGPYFDEYLKMADIDEEAGEGPRAGVQPDQVSELLDKKDLEVMKATLKKLWLQDFHAAVMKLGGTTAECLGHILKTEADFRALLVTLNTKNTDLSSESNLKAKRNPLFPQFGYLYPDGSKNLYAAFDDNTISLALEPFAKYHNMYNSVKSFYDSEAKRDSMQQITSIEDLIYAQNVEMYELAFEQQYHFGILYAWLKLKEQEIRNIKWIADMIVLGRRDAASFDAVVQIFKPRM